MEIYKCQFAIIREFLRILIVWTILRQLYGHCCTKICEIVRRDYLI